MNIKKNNKNHFEERDDKIIIFGNINNMKELENIKQQEFFIDSTFKIVPKKFSNHKLLTISYISESKIKIFCFVLYKYQDYTNYKRIFLYLKDNYYFNPIIVHTDYEKALYSIFYKDNLFKNKVLHCFCFFHYLKEIRERMKNSNLIGKKLNKKAFEILKNIEILSFINKNKLDEYIKFICQEIEKKEGYKNLVKYLKQNWFNKNSDMYNYSILIDKKRK